MKEIPSNHTGSHDFIVVYLGTTEADTGDVSKKMFTDMKHVRCDNILFVT